VEKYFLFLFLFYFSNHFSGSLQITNSEEEDQGKYECVAENSLGIEISNVSTLHVRGEPQPSSTQFY
jgi:hypothetical protein